MEEAPLGNLYFRGQSHSTRTTGDGIVSRVKKYNKDLSIVHTFDKPQQFIEAIDSTTSNQLFFLDIEIKGEKLKGLDIAKIIREKIPTLLLSLSLPTQSLCH
ncbi:hypothetical protein [Streptococcus sp. HSISS2]|uniref:hypothetical protein n=1 Tax=Streptococcus sp. HSISS2 TaxID=1316411 RepID=UPI001F0B4520